MANEYSTTFVGKSQVVELFECVQDLSNSYLFSKLQYAFKALSISQKTSLRINSAGMLAMQFLIPVDQESLFVELYMLPSIDAD